MNALDNDLFSFRNIKYNTSVVGGVALDKVNGCKVVPLFNVIFLDAPSCLTVEGWVHGAAFLESGQRFQVFLFDLFVSMDVEIDAWFYQRLDY